ncbi:type I DNA topoisomerase [Nocardioides sp.]|uniref:type I DNA topoisomerase n=1 Tax=Nocardioides sp. TaxID=35761 RepID=UPI0026362A73|nr:type I DNA topoisomerase [Nocardioides sp.]
MAHKLVIVESPAKARTIGGYLGDGFVVESSIGHIRDLPQSAADTPAKIKDKPWGRLGVDTENGFEPYYIVPRDKKSHITKLKGLLKGADELYLATDEDREGEAIAWHLLDELKPKNIPVKRMVFHEITKAAIQEAAANPRELDMDLVEAQETRRILDRLYGYEVSPVLWRKVQSGLSAGRVQSVATRLVVQRERDRMAYKVASYWSLEGSFDAGSAAGGVRIFPAKIYSVDGTRVATGSNFDSEGKLTGKVVHLDRSKAEALVEALSDTTYDVRSVESKPYRRSPYAPFRTTTLQQEASRKLGMSSSVTMSVAQRLYENGFITYMRTDSVSLSDTAIRAARAQVNELYGADYLPDAPRVYASKVKNAQEAHEAIRPSGDTFRTPAQTGLTGDQFRLYELIWMRTVASQMKDAVGQTVSIRLGGAATSGEDVVFGTSGRVITFHGFLKAYVEGTDSADSEKDDAETRLPNLTEGDQVTSASLGASGHETKPPARYTEATLIKELEDREIGRPSTYASIISTIINRGYVYKKGTALVPAWIAFSATRLLEEHFTDYVDYDFTASMERVLDEIAGGRATREDELGRFYFGPAEGAADDGQSHREGLKQIVDSLGDIDAKGNATFPIGGEDSGIQLRVGKFGPYLEGPDDDGTPLGKRANVPDDLPPDELTLERAKELLANPTGVDIELGVHPESGLKVVAKAGRYGPYVTEVLPEDAPKSAKPRTASLFKNMTLESITLAEAVQLLTLPRVVGAAEDGEEITAQNGRFGPYLKKGTDSRSLTSEDQLLTITLPEALAIYAQPKARGRAAAAPPLKEFGNDPVSGAPIVAKSGRFGDYVTDGEYNATLRKEDDLATMTLERAAELLAERRAKGPAKKGAKKTAKKAATKKTAAKKTATKAAAKKTAAKKTTKTAAKKA